MSFKFFNVPEGLVTHTPLFIIHGQSLVSQSGHVTVSSKTGKFPPLHYEVNSGFFKIITHLEHGVNDLIVGQYEGKIANGFPVKMHYYKQVAVQELRIIYDQLTQNKPIHLCVLLAADSQGTFDSTTPKRTTEGNGLNLAVKKLRVAGRLMQAYTNEQMIRNGFGNRTFNFVEEQVRDTVFLQENETQIRPTIKIHVIRSKRTLAEIRSPNIAQQNEKGTERSKLFDYADEALQDYGAPFSTATPSNPVQAAVLLLDAHWDTQLKLILAHAALGGGTDRLKLAIFGSHGLFSWPSFYEQIATAFQDTTPSNINEVANDSRECGSYWECLNITMGAFLHEIGHSLGCPHQTSGIMLRDYVTFNRSFVSREERCLRTGSNGKAPLKPDEECRWHRLDTLRFLFHPSFTLSEDYNDPGFAKDASGGSGKAALFPLGSSQALIRSETGIFSLELHKDGGELAEGYVEYTPLSAGGKGIPREIVINYDDLKMALPPEKRSGDYDLHILTVDGSQSEFRNLHSILVNPDNVVRSDFGRGKGILTGIKSGAFGNAGNGSKRPMAVIDPKRVNNVRVYHGAALDGIRFDFADPSPSQPQPQPQPQPRPRPPTVPERNYKKSGNLFNSMLNSFKNISINEPNNRPITGSQTFGNTTPNYTDFPLAPGEQITHFKIRSGGWVDAIQIFTNQGRCSPMLGNAQGGSEGVIRAPHGFEIVGVVGTVGQWIDSISFVYARVNQ